MLHPDDRAEKIALEIRDRLHAQSVGYFESRTLLHKAQAYLDISYCEDSSLQGAEGVWDSSIRRIFFPEHTFVRAASGSPRERMSVAHEVVHAAREHRGIRNRSTANIELERFVRAVKNDEFEAKRVAPAILAPFHKIREISAVSATQIAFHFGLSNEAAAIRHEQYTAHERRRKGGGRTAPDFVYKTIRELSKNDMTVPKLVFIREACVACGSERVIEVGTKVLCIDCDHVQGPEN